MAEFKMPKYIYKDKPLSLDKCYQELSELSYQSPVEIINQGFTSKLEGDIYEAIQTYGIAVDKDELVKALKYDRNQYEKGFIDGCKTNTSTIKAEAIKEFAERLKADIRKNMFAYPASEYCENIDNLVKEMTNS